AYCQDISSDPTTGDLVQATIGASGITCPNVQGTCTVRTAYNLVPNAPAGTDATQATISARPVLMARAIPILGVERACLWYPDGIHWLASTAPMTWGPAPLTIGGLFMNQAAGIRPPNQLYYLILAGGNYEGTTSTVVRPGTADLPAISFAQP